MPETTNNDAPGADRPTAHGPGGARKGRRARPSRGRTEAEQVARRAVGHGAGHVAVNAARQAASPAADAEGGTGEKPDEDRIRRRAHELWEHEGRPVGRHEEHWARARREVEAEDGGGPAPEPAAPDASPTDIAPA